MRWQMIAGMRNLSRGILGGGTVLCPRLAMVCARLGAVGCGAAAFLEESARDAVRVAHDPRVSRPGRALIQDHLMGNLFRRACKGFLSELSDVPR
jgi:hypothetical protein